MSKRKPPTILNMQKRIQILDWLRAHPDDILNMTGPEIIKAVSESINHSCNLNQIRQIAKAGNLRWQIKKSMPSGKTGTGGRMDKLEARIKTLETWCYNTAVELGVKLPETPSDLPGDDEL